MLGFAVGWTEMDAGDCWPRASAHEITASSTIANDLHEGSLNALSIRLVFGYANNFEHLVEFDFPAFDLSVSRHVVDL